MAADYSIEVVIPNVGPAGPAGPPGEPGPPGEVGGTLAWSNVTDKPSTFPPSAHGHVAADISDFAAAAAAAAPAPDWNSLSGKPATFPPSAHTHAIGEVTNLQTALDAKAATSHTHTAAAITDFNTAAAAAAPVASVAGKTGAVTLAKGDVGLGSVDNTSDANKPVSTATQTALDTKAATSHTHGNITNAGAIGSTSGLPVVTGASGAITTLPLGTAGQVLAVNSGANGLEFVAGGGGGGGVTGVDASLADIFSVSGSNLVADDLAADKLYGWDDSAAKSIGFTIGAGLETDGNTLKAVTPTEFLTKAAYNDLGSPDANTLYVITDP